MSYVRKNHDNIAIGLIIALMVFQVSLQKIFAGFIPAFNYSYNTPWMCVMYVIIIISVYGLVIVPRVFGQEKSDNLLKKYKILVLELVILLLAIISTDVVTIVRGQLRITNIFTHNLDYFYAFLALPIAVLLADGRWKLESMVRIMLILTIASCVMRVFVSVYFGITGIEIRCISQESSMGYWVRNGRLRMVAPCFLLLLVPVLSYLFVKAKSLRDRIIYGLSVCAFIFYVFYIWQSRACLIYIAASLGVLFMFWPASKKITSIKWGAAFAALAIFLLFGGMQILIDQFSTSETSKYYMENKGHYYVYELFWGKYLKSPIFGDGLTETLAEWFPNGRALWLSDGGFLYSIVPMGILMIVFFLFVLIRCVILYFRSCRKSDLSVLALALTAMIYVCGVSIDCFMTGIAFSVPFYLAIVEYISQTANSLSQNVNSPDEDVSI